MPWYTFGSKRQVREAVPAPVPAALTAAAAPPRGPDAQFVRRPDKWQNEVWNYYDTLGEFNYGVWWLSNMLSRVRLRAARLQPDVDEPDVQDNGPASDLMMRLGGGVSGQAQIMKRLTVQLSLPGEGYLIGESVDGVERWQVRSVDEIRAQSGTYYVMDEESVSSGQQWRPVADDNHVVRVWRPHDRYFHLADSPSRSAREIMRELELVNRHISAQYLSRLASAGLLKIPDEITFPVREEFLDAPNPIMSEFIEIAAEAIKTPGTASAVIPIPISGPAEALKEMGLVDFTLKIDEKIIEKRDSAIKRLATKLDLPAEVLLGMGDLNHWGAWALDEAALKTHIAPVAELICDSLTRGYLQPRLAASGEDPSDWVVWYDMSELALRPDRSSNATEAYDRMELSGQAYRRELGFDEDDKPMDEDLVEQGLKIIVRTVPNAAPAALDKLTGQDVLDPDLLKPAAPKPTGPQGVVPPQGDENAPPGTLEKPPPAQGQAASVRLQQSMQQARTQHAIRFGTGSRWELLHPEVCSGQVFGCPFTHAVSTAAPMSRPGTSGTYLCHLDAFGLLAIDGQSPYMDTTKMLTTSLVPRSNGHARA